MQRKNVPFSSWQLWIKRELQAANRRFHKRVKTAKMIQSYIDKTMFSIQEEDVGVFDTYDVGISQVNRG